MWGSKTVGSGEWYSTGRKGSADCTVRYPSPLPTVFEPHMRRLVPALTAGALVTSGPHWSAAAPLPEPIQETPAAVLHGKIYIAGGIDRADRATAAAYRYDPAANRWERIADLPAPRHHMPLAVAGDTLYAVGGLAETSFVPESNLWIYREDRNGWESRAPLPEPRGASGVGVVSGKLVVVGGWGMGRVLLDSTAIYDPAANRWQHAAPIPTPRDHLTAAAAGGLVYAIGGPPPGPRRHLPPLRALHPPPPPPSPRDPMPSRRGGLASAVLDGRIHTFGGETRSSVLDNHEIYD